MGLTGDLGEWVKRAGAGKQLVVRPVLEGFPKAHLWSIGATEGTQSIRLDTLDEGQTRLLACPPASPSCPGADCSPLCNLRCIRKTLLIHTAMMCTSSYAS